MGKRNHKYLCGNCGTLLTIESKSNYPYIYHGTCFCSYKCMTTYKKWIKKIKLLGVDVNDEERNKD